MNFRFATGLLCDYISTSFIVLEIDKSLKFMKATYFIPTIVASVLYFAFLIIGLPKRKKIDYQTIATNQTKAAEPKKTD